MSFNGNNLYVEVDVVVEPVLDDVNDTFGLGGTLHVFEPGGGGFVEAIPARRRLADAMAELFIRWNII